MVAKGDISAIRTLIESTHPILLEEIPITMEEVFVYEMEAKGYGQLV
jgi:ABC-2 type transport system ATP-binding protein